MARSTTCKVGNGRSVSIAEALELRRKHGRFVGQCEECGQHVKAHKASEYGEAHFEHFDRNEKCSLSDPHRS